jgi:hypothetical protein
LLSANLFIVFLALLTVTTFCCDDQISVDLLLSSQFWSSKAVIITLTKYYFNPSLRHSSKTSCQRLMKIVDDEIRRKNITMNQHQVPSTVPILLLVITVLIFIKEETRRL